MTEFAYRDALTEIDNWRYCYEIAAIEPSRCKRRDLQASLLMLGLNNFKAINDRFGHEGGDIVLHESVALISALLRSYEIFGRLGGEEFGVLLPETDLEGAEVIANRILKLREHKFFAPA